MNDKSNIRDSKKVQLKTLSASNASVYLKQIASLRIEIFKDYPYLYEGDFDYEKTYLERYLNAKNAVFVLALNSSQEIIGVATCIHAIEEEAFIQKPLLENGFDLKNIFYFGESLLLPAYRGLGIGHLFFEEREKYASSVTDISHTVFCAVDRPEEHPLKPKLYNPLDQFWIKKGYNKSEIKTQMLWKDKDQQETSTKSFFFWIKNWRDQ